MSELMSIASRKRTACNSIFVWSSVAKTTAPRHRQDIVNGIVKKPSRRAHTAYIHDLCRASDICLRHTVYKDHRKCRVPRRAAFSPFFSVARRRIEMGR